MSFRNNKGYLSTAELVMVFNLYYTKKNRKRDFLSRQDGTESVYYITGNLIESEMNMHLRKALYSFKMNFDWIIKYENVIFRL